MTNGIVYIIGNKSFGDSNGIIYSKRNKNDYYMQTVALDEAIYKQNEYLKEKFTNRYIDMINYVSNQNGRIRVFTDTNKFISQDTKHLTRAGAIYYSKLIDWNLIFNI